MRSPAGSSKFTEKLFGRRCCSSPRDFTVEPVSELSIVCVNEMRAVLIVAYAATARSSVLSAAVCASTGAAVITLANSAVAPRAIRALIVIRSTTPPPRPRFAAPA